MGDAVQLRCHPEGAAGKCRMKHEACMSIWFPLAERGVHAASASYCQTRLKPNAELRGARPPRASLDAPSRPAFSGCDGFSACAQFPAVGVFREGAENSARGGRAPLSISEFGLKRAKARAPFLFWQPTGYAGEVGVVELRPAKRGSRTGEQLPQPIHAGRATPPWRCDRDGAPNSSSARPALAASKCAPNGNSALRPGPGLGSAPPPPSTTGVFPSLTRLLQNSVAADVVGANI